MKVPSRSANDYRARSADVRRMAGTTRFNDLRCALLNLADTFDQLAGEVGSDRELPSRVSAAAGLGS
jgi:hypothetical protein